jgi:hypothetical protein
MGRMNGILKNHVFPHEFLDIDIETQTSGSPHVLFRMFLGSRWVHSESEVFKLED